MQSKVVLSFLLKITPSLNFTLHKYECVLSARKSLPYGIVYFHSGGAGELLGHMDSYTLVLIFFVNQDKISPRVCLSGLPLKLQRMYLNCASLPECFCQCREKVETLISALERCQLSVALAAGGFVSYTGKVQTGVGSGHSPAGAASAVLRGGRDPLSPPAGLCPVQPRTAFTPSAGRAES